MEYLPDRNSRYKDVDYWDERYKTEKSFEWFGDFSKFQHLLQRHVMKDDAILVLGVSHLPHLSLSPPPPGVSHLPHLSLSPPPPGVSHLPHLSLSPPPPGVSHLPHLSLSPPPPGVSHLPHLSLSPPPPGVSHLPHLSLSTTPPGVPQLPHLSSGYLNLCFLSVCYQFVLLFQVDQCVVLVPGFSQSLFFSSSWFLTLDCPDPVPARLTTLPVPDIEPACRPVP
ncbi:YLP motif-containing protein 1 isoform X9 [Oncorhynchus keta]|uniref:YLP motif-containing protein 1 isoform X8 n=1 Tax=Oncorhynchus keta TaxID=8018 RepID=UPI00227A4077|nr:YLP motif-containing protein 1 isoform X8 [Oncorhynchus keta]XP_052332289.1 YLP motif-containing protein 1 isoform X9 [Oncorhynchus keta]